MQTGSPSPTERRFRGPAALVAAALLALAFFLAACVPSPAHFLKIDNTFSNTGPTANPRAGRPSHHVVTGVWMGLLSNRGIFLH